MQILIRASESQKAILLQKDVLPDTQILWYNDVVVPADAYIDLLFEDKPEIFKDIKDKPVIVSAVIATCIHLPENYCRINAWNTFLEKQKLEAATANVSMQALFENVLLQIGFGCWFVADIVGMIAARSIAMIINEAYFGLQDGISTTGQIDTAMKLGTNYPYGPFEWAEKIGLQRINQLLLALAETDARYTPCSAIMSANNS